MEMNVSTIVPYFRIICYWIKRLGIKVMKRTVGYMAFRRALSTNLSPRSILAFGDMCLLTGRFDTK